jgi:hypothetical protein
MKKALLILAFISIKGFSQPLIYEKVTHLDSTLTEQILFERLNSSLIVLLGGQDNFNKNIIQSDKQNFTIKFKQELTYSKNELMNSANGTIFFNVNVYFKKGRYKIIIDNIVHKGIGISMNELTQDKEYPYNNSNYLKFRKRKWIEIKEWIELEIPKTIVAIEKIINKPLEQESNW